uniref:Uncharacterized protein n=1 Tax=Peronospora matthiolae TaxID=2874970 RepID=A0AAV1TAR2_9STRA
MHEFMCEILGNCPEEIVQLTRFDNYQRNRSEIWMLEAFAGYEVSKISVSGATSRTHMERLGRLQSWLHDHSTRYTTPDTGEK